MTHFPWFKITLPIASIFAFRMLGLFMLIPVFTIYGNELTSATPGLIGLALGAYGLSQGLMQMPFGILSDYFGRKPILYLGLSLFAAGSLFAAYTDSIYGMIFARMLQGCGAIGSVLIALIADNIPDEHRAKSMAIIGASIGLSFAIAMSLSPILASRFALAGIFYFTAILAIIGIIILKFFIPNSSEKPSSNFQFKSIKQACCTADLLSCHIGIWCQHFILTASFFAIPLILKNMVHETSYFYLALMLPSFILMMGILTVMERKKKRPLLFKLSFILLCVSQIMLLFCSQHLSTLYISLFIYFVAFNSLEALFPAMIAKAAPLHLKGTATGIYSSAQFLGIFCGGSLAGIMYQHYSISGIFCMNIILTLMYIWRFIRRH